MLLSQVQKILSRQTYRYTLQTNCYIWPPSGQYQSVFEKYTASNENEEQKLKDRICKPRKQYVTYNVVNGVFNGTDRKHGNERY